MQHEVPVPASGVQRGQQYASRLYISIVVEGHKCKILPISASTSMDIRVTDDGDYPVRFQAPSPILCEGQMLVFLLQKSADSNQSLHSGADGDSSR
jgi:hypothetical protein